MRVYAEIRQRQKDAGLPDPLMGYKLHKSNAKARGIEFLFTFEEWWAMWESHWSRRGRGSLDLCMCRKDDIGPYAVGNVRIATNKENNHERSLMARIRRAPTKYRPPRSYKPPVSTESAGWLMGIYGKNETLADELLTMAELESRI